MLNKNTDKEQFENYQEVKQSANQLWIRVLKVVKKYLFDQHQQNFSCDDDMEDAVVKRIN